MAEYHVGCGSLGIYAGTLSKRRKDGVQLWQNKSDVTREAIDAVAQYLLEQEMRVHFTYQGKHYVLCVQEEEDDEQ